MPNSSLNHGIFCRYLALSTALFFCFSFVLVHFVRGDLDLLRTTLSIYAVGPAGWVLTLGFYGIAITEFLIAWSLLQTRQTTGDLVITALLALAAIGAVLVAAFPYSVKLPHNTGAVLQLGLFPLFLLIRVWLHRDDILWTFSAGIAFLCNLCFLLMLWDGLEIYDFVSLGTVQKLEIICIALWLVIYSWHLPVPQAHAFR